MQKAGALPYSVRICALCGCFRRVLMKACIAFLAVLLLGVLRWAQGQPPGEFTERCLRLLL